MEHFFHVVGALLGSLRAFYRQVHGRYFGSIERFDGNATQICRQIVEKLWEGNFYRTSLGHFDFFLDARFRHSGRLAHPARPS